MTATLHRQTAIEAGMILVSSWDAGARVDYYLVTRSAGRSVWLRPIAAEVQREPGQMVEVIHPAPWAPLGPEVHRRIYQSTEGPRVTTTMGHLARPWNGEGATRFAAV